jgi:ATP phosphoribosyltransferase
MAERRNSDQDVSRNMLLAVPKKGRLHEKIMKLVEGIGLDYVRPNRLDIAHCTSFPLTLVFLPAADIAAYVGEGNVDMGITGEDIIAESEADVNLLMKLGFGKCKLSVLAPKGEVTDPASLAGKRIVTSFPNIARNFFKELETGDKQTSIKYVSGSVEAACGLGLADAVVDLVETGTTMKAAGLEAVHTIMSTQTVLISNKHTTHAENVDIIYRRIQGYQTAKSYQMLQYNVSPKALSEAVKITPGRRAPNITQTEDKDVVSVSAMVTKKEAIACMDSLEKIGAEDILLFDLSNFRDCHAK